MGKYPLDYNETIELGREYFRKDGLAFSKIDVDFVSAMVNLVNDAYSHGYSDGKHEKVGDKSGNSD